MASLDLHLLIIDLLLSSCLKAVQHTYNKTSINCTIIRNHQLIIYKTKRGLKGVVPFVCFPSLCLCYLFQLK